MIMKIKYIELLPGLRIVFYDGVDDRELPYVCGQITYSFLTEGKRIVAFIRFKTVNSLIHKDNIHAFNTEGLKRLLGEALLKELPEDSFINNIHWNFDKMLSATRFMD